MVVGLAVYGLLGRTGYPAVAVSLALVAAGLRVVGVVAATNVLRGLPAERTTIGAALTDTVTQVAAGLGLAVAGTVLAALVGSGLTDLPWTAGEAHRFGAAITVGGLALTAAAAALVAFGFLRTRTRHVAPVAR